ncbi:hypothetical protein L1987_15215 [Smallanthus sonchifolius]|uniref:Uncharacterized protein n=1 Tax=Smallanthus sonchifolius TaxID=185202 RepID=A0ACB9J4U6_9ASTR|nr:hypothetical protein L1987_15215 [Smallanthus sonchifolius]
MFDAAEKPISSNFGLQQIRLLAGNLFISRRTQLSATLSLICSNLYLENESIDELISRLYHLKTELNSYELKYPDDELVEKFLDSLPPKFDMYTTLLRENPKFYEMTVDETIGKVQAHYMNLKKKESSGRPQIQDPYMYYRVSSTAKSSGSGIALFSGTPHQEDNSNGCGGHAYLAASGSSSCHLHSSRNLISTPSTNQTTISKIAEDHVALFSSCMLAYENFIGGKLTDPETIEEDFNQVDPDEMEDMDIQWNMAMILRRAKRFLNRTGRKFIGGLSNIKVGFDKSKAKCYKSQNFGHFAREYQKDKAPPSGFTRPSQGNNQIYNNQNNRSQSQGGTSSALVVQQDDSFNWRVHLEDAIISQTQLGLMGDIVELMEAKRREASVADQPESASAFALMAIGEASSSSIGVDSNSFAVISCSKCLILKDKNDRIHDQLEPLRSVALNYKENEKRIKDSIENLKKERHEFSIKISEQQFHLDVAYKGLEKRNVEIARLQNEILQLSGKLEKLKNSRFVVEHYESVVKKVSGKGLGTNAIPPPVSGKFVNVLVDIDLSFLDDSSSKDYSSSKAESASDEEFFSDEGSEYQVGHILVKCPDKNQGKWPVVPQQVAVPKTPTVKQPKSPKSNVVKPPQLAGCQPGEPSTSSPVIDKSRPTVQKTQKKRSWSKKTKSSQSSDPKSPKDSPIFASHDCELIEGHPNGTTANRWYVDSGCSRHMKGNMALLQDVKPFRGGYVAFAGEKGGSITCQGVVSKGCIGFDNVNFCEQLKHNLLSVSQMCDKEYSVMFNTSECLVLKPGFEVLDDWILMRAPRTNDTYQIDMSVATTTSSVATCLLTKATELDSILWHRKLGHISYRKMNHLVRNGLVTGIPKLRFAVADDCMPCIKGKQQRKSHKPKTQNSIDTPLELLHMDLFGPISIRSIGGKSYCLVITDDFSHFSRVNFLGTKDETAEILQYLILNLESLCMLKVRRIRSDNGTEFKNNMMELFCLKKGIRHEFSAPYTPQQNGVAERKNKSLIETARTMLSDAKLPITFWAEAVNTDCHVLNTVLVVKRHNKTCYELINKRPPNLDYLVHLVVPIHYCYNTSITNQNFIQKRWKAFSYDMLPIHHARGCTILNLAQLKSGLKWNAVKNNIPPEPTGPSWGFDYDVLFKSFNLPALSAEDAANLYQFYSGGDDSNFLTRSTVPIPTPDSNVASTSGTLGSNNEDDVHVEGNDAQADTNTHVGNEAPADPIDIESSLGTLDMGELSANLESNIQEQLVPEMRVPKIHPIDNIIGDLNAGVQTRKRTITENTSLYAEILDTGIMETCLHATFVSQLEPKNVKEALTDNCWIEAMQDELSQFQKLHVWDLVDLLKCVHPIGSRWVFKCKTDDRHVVVKKKRKAYAFFFGFRVYQLDVKSAFPYEKVHEEVYVPQPPGFEDPHNLNKVYKLDKALYDLHQAPRAWEFEQDILSKYKMNDCTTYGTPIAVNHGLHPDKDGKDVDCKLYRGMIGSLMYLTATRPHILFAVFLCLRFQSQPKESHLIAVKRIFRYLKGKPRLGLWLVSWQCKKQSTVSVSTCEAEYIDAASCCSQIL